MRAFLILCLLACEAGAATWYVRPGVFTTLDASGHPIPTAGVYGTQNGTSYANAWNGLTSIVWGPSGVNVGDTLYACGTHIYTIPSFTTNWFQQAVTTIGVSGITIRGDYLSDPFTLFGGAVDHYHFDLAYTGPDGNGVYAQKQQNGGAEFPLFEITGVSVTRLALQTNSTWAGVGNGQFSLTGTNYVRRTDGQPPTINNMAQQRYGWAFNLNNQSNLTFKSCHFISEMATDPALFGGIQAPVPVSPFTAATTHITFDGCTFVDSQQFNVYPGEDYFAFLNCEIARHASGVYTIINGQTAGANRLTVSNCFIHDTGTVEYNDGDAHAVGIQGGNYHLITHNVTSNTGPSILFWTGAVDMKSNTVSYNLVIDTKTNTSSGISDGISISGDNATALLGRRDGFRIFGNIVTNCAIGNGDTWQGISIQCNSPDSVEILNNTLYGGKYGINIQVVHAGYSVSAAIKNNIIINPVTSYYYIVGNVAPTSLSIDYDLLYPVAGATNAQITVSPPVMRDFHSVFANPLLNVSSRLTPGSPAIQSGVNVWISYDYASHPFASPPSIGALEYVGVTNVAASCSQADIQAAIALSIPGDTVIVPAGTCAPTISILLTNQITLQAQGTILQDSIINAGDGANSSIIQVAVGPTPPLVTRVTGFTFQTGARATKLFDSGNIHLGGGANLVRIDHCNFLATQNIGIGGGDVFGVIDHNVFAPPGAFTQPMKLTHQSYGGAANGYGSWALPSWTNSYHEDASALYIEDNTGTNSSGSPGIGIDGFAGARWVDRHNIWDRIIDGGHGTETTAQYAGCRLKDVYNNLFIEHGDSEPGHWRSGSGACVSNTVISCPNQFQARNYRGAFGGFYHYANATNAWDLNDATIYAAGNATAGGTLTMTDSGQAWTPSQWIGYTIRNVSSGQGSIINASTATTVSYAPPTEGANMAFTPGQTYQFRKVVTILDEVGRGQGSLRNNTLPAWPNQAVDPVYNWANTFDGASKLMDNGGYYTSVVGQEIINGINVNWLPYTYPHPLVGSSVAAVTITAQPHSTNVYASQTALFTITATGSPQPFTYQWTTNGVNAGTNGPALSVGPCPVAWSGMNVICVVANAAGFATSATATLTVLPDPVITAQPNNATVGVGSTASFSVTATGQTGLTYQWSKNGSSILGATHSSYVTPVTVSGDNNSQFFAVVTDTAGSLQSGNATLTVTNIISPPDPVITSQPQSTNIFATQPAAFSITATGGTPLSYQWKTNGVNSVTTQTLTFPSCPAAWSGMTIVCVVTDVAGSVTSSIATLTIGADPVIATQPQNTSRFANTTASFNVSATGQTALTYQWSRNGVSVAGATQSAYTTPSLTMANNGDAYCVDATDTAGTLRSANATLTVLPAPGGPTQIARVTTLRVGTTKAGP